MVMGEKTTPSNYTALFWTFFKISSTAFGGFMALISVVQNYVVERRQLLSHEEMLDGISIATVLPGPVAMNVVAYVGYKIRGWLGTLVCTMAVILPTFLLVLFLSYSYFTWGEVPMVNRFFQGFIPAVTAIIVATVWNIGRKSLKSVSEYFIAVAACLSLVTIGGFIITLCIILMSGFLGYWFYGKPMSKYENPVHRTKPAKTSKNKNNETKLRGSSVIAIVSASAPFLSADLLMAAKLLFSFAGMSLILFGGGFVFIPLIQEVVVEGYGWVTHKEFIDGIALGQVTPGPILISAAFIGYKMAGLAGAAAATVGIFTPPALLMIICTHYMDRIKRSTLLQASMRGVRAGVIGMILAAAYAVASTAEPNWIYLLIFSATLLSLLKYKFEVAMIIPAAGVTGLLLY
jgi:chromate transporter